MSARQALCVAQAIPPAFAGKIAGGTLSVGQCFTPRRRVVDGGGCSVTTGVAKVTFGTPEPTTGASASIFVSPL